MNILIVSAMFPPIRTGTSFYTQNLAEEFHRGGHQVSVVTLKNSDDHHSNFPFRVHRLPALHFGLKNYFKHFRISSVFWGNYRQIEKIVSTRKPEIILLVNHYLDIAFLAIRAAHKNKIPLVISVGTELQSLNPSRDKVLNFLDRQICGRFIFPKCVKIIAWDREIQRYLQDINGRNILKKTEIIGYSVHGRIRDFTRHNHDYSKQNQIIGIGAIIEQRNFILLIRLFKKLIKEIPNLKLKIIGHIYYQETAKLITRLGLKERVELTGELPHEKVLTELKNSTVYWGAASGKYLGIGTATLEAMLLGVPVISNVPENILGKKKFSDLKNIILVGHSEKETLTKLKKVIVDEKLRRKIGKSGQKFVITNMNWKKVAGEMINLFQRVVRENDL